MGDHRALQNQQSGFGTSYWNYRSWQLSTSIWHVNTLARCMNVITKRSQEFWPIRDQSTDNPKKKKKSLVLHSRFESPHNCMCFKVLVHPKNENSHSPLSHQTCLAFFLFCRCLAGWWRCALPCKSLGSM